MSDLVDRYGTRRGPRLAVVVIVGTLIAALSGMLIWIAVSVSSPTVNSALIGFRIVDDNLATAQFVVKRESADVVAVCTIKAVAEDFGLVGADQLVIDSGELEQRFEVEIRTERRATSVSTEGCTAQGQPRPR